MTTIPRRTASAAKVMSFPTPASGRTIDFRSWEIGEAFHQGMLLEVCAGPKPGLVCPDSNGSHTDMGLRTFMVGAAAIAPALVQCAQSGREHTLDLPSLLPEMRRIGVRYERRLLEATKQVNTQRGILFAAGLLCGAAGYLSRFHSSIDPGLLFTTVAAMSKGLVERELSLAGLSGKSGLTAGEKLFLKYGAEGIRGEMERGLPSVRETGLPALVEALDRGCSLNLAMVHCLVSLMTCVEDTTILWRKGPAALKTIHGDAREVLLLGSVFTKTGMEQICRLDGEYKAENISPGGCADMLAISLGIYVLVNGAFPCAII